MRRHTIIGCGLLACLMMGWGAWLTASANRFEREREEIILGLQAQRVARHVDAWKPQYGDYFYRFINSERSQMRVLLYDLSGWEMGRPIGTQVPVPFNETAAHFATPKILRPLHKETPLPSFTPHEAEKARIGMNLPNLFFASNVIGAALISKVQSPAGETWLVATTPVADFDAATHWSFISAWIQAAVPFSVIVRPALERWTRFALLSALGWVIFGGIVWASLKQGRSLKAAAAVAEQLPLDRLAVTRLPELYDDPDGQRLVHACNRLLDKVAEAHVAQQRFVADAAHELRTPLTILRGEIQVALREPENRSFLIETLRSSLDEAVHLSRLVDSLLTLARADAGQTIVSREPIQPAPVVQACLARLEPLAAAGKVRLDFEMDKEAETAATNGDGIALERIIRNLVENAVKHSSSGHAVRVLLKTTNDKIRLSVTDAGIGIPPEHLSKVFDRFYRIDAARRRTEGGAGLGLAIVKTLAEAQGGTVSVASEIGEGSTFTVELPRLPAKQP